jgi:hypothetical protein
MMKEVFMLGQMVGGCIGLTSSVKNIFLICCKARVISGTYLRIRSLGRTGFEGFPSKWFFVEPPHVHTKQLEFVPKNE